MKRKEACVDKLLLIENIKTYTVKFVVLFINFLGLSVIFFMPLIDLFFRLFYNNSFKEKKITYINLVRKIILIIKEKIITRSNFFSIFLKILIFNFLVISNLIILLLGKILLNNVEEKKYQNKIIEGKIRVSDYKKYKTINREKFNKKETNFEKIKNSIIESSIKYVIPILEFYIFSPIDLNKLLPKYLEKWKNEQIKYEIKHLGWYEFIKIISINAVLFPIIFIIFNLLINFILLSYKEKEKNFKLKLKSNVIIERSFGLSIKNTKKETLTNFINLLLLYLFYSREKNIIYMNYNMISSSLIKLMFSLPTEKINSLLLNRET